MHCVYSIQHLTYDTIHLWLLLLSPKKAMKSRKRTWVLGWEIPIMELNIYSVVCCFSFMPQRKSLTFLPKPILNPKSIMWKWIKRRRCVSCWGRKRWICISPVQETPITVLSNSIQFIHVEKIILAIFYFLTWKANKSLDGGACSIWGRKMDRVREWQ